MSDQMLFQNIRPIERFAALCTVVQFLSSVNHYMAFKLTSRNK